MTFAEKLQRLLQETKQRRERTGTLSGRYFWLSGDARQYLLGKSKQGLNERTFAYHQGTFEVLEDIMYVLETALQAGHTRAMKRALRAELSPLLERIKINRDVMEHPDKHRHHYSEFGVWVCTARARVSLYYYNRLFWLAYERAPDHSCAPAEVDPKLINRQLPRITAGRGKLPS